MDIANPIKLKVVLRCGQVLLSCYCCFVSGEDSLLSPQLEHWKIVPEAFIIFREMSNEVDHRTYHNFYRQQWQPPFVFDHKSYLSTYNLSVFVLLIIVFIIICVLSLIYCTYQIYQAFCRNNRYSKVRSHRDGTSILKKDLIEAGVLNV